MRMPATSAPSRGAASAASASPSSTERGPGPGPRERVREARSVIERLVASGEVVYGVTTGFGALATAYVPPDRARALQERLLLSHAAGVGDPPPVPVVRAMLLLRANTLALGH